MINDLIEKMEKTIEATKRQLGTIRTGRAHADMLSRVMVDYYGSMVPLKQVASINIPESSCFLLNVFDKNAVKNVEKAILTSDLNVNPQIEGAAVRIRLPDLTEERRKELVKLLKKQGEDAKVILRNIRRDYLDHLKKQEKDAHISEDDSKRFHEQAQKETDKYIGLIDHLMHDKEAEIMKV